MGAKVHLKIKRLPSWGLEGEDFSGAMGGGPILLELISPHCGSAYKLWREDLPDHNAHPGHHLGSVTNSSSGLIFVKIRAESGRIFSKNPGKIRAKIRAKLNFVILSYFYDLGHVQTGILPFGEQLHNALNVH